METTIDREERWEWSALHPPAQDSPVASGCSRICFTPVRRALLALLGALLATERRARADDPDDPVRLVIATAGFLLGGHRSRDHPASAVPRRPLRGGAMNTTSTTVVSTKRQGVETLRPGSRGLAEEAPRSSGIPPAKDQWEQLGVPVTTIDLADSADAVDAEAAQEIPAALEVETSSRSPSPSSPERGDPGRTEALTALDESVGAMPEAGGCEHGPPRTLPVSVAATDPEDPRRSSIGAVASPAPSACRSRSTPPSPPGPHQRCRYLKQNGVVVLTDVVATILASHDVSRRPDPRPAVPRHRPRRLQQLAPGPPSRPRRSMPRPCRRSAPGSCSA